MPTYGDEKRLEMARSILPASARARKPARDHRARVHRAVRAKVRQRLATTSLDDDFDADAAIGPDARRAPYGGTRALVSRRRGADKLGPFLRWADAHADELGDTPDARLAALRSVLPAGVIGDHAISHLEREPSFKVTLDWFDYLTLRSDRAGAKARYLSHIDRDLRDRLFANIDRVGELNRRLKRCHDTEHGGAARLLGGAHDVNAFARFIAQELSTATMPAGRDVWRRGRAATVLDFCDLATPPWWT